MNILIIGNDEKYDKVLKIYLEKKGNSVRYINKAISGIEESKAKVYDLIIIDIHKEIISAVQTLEMIFLERSQAKVMMLVEEVEEKEEVQVLEMGAREYQSKAKSFSVILERTKKMVEIVQEEGKKILESKEEKIRVYVDERIVEKNSEEVEITNLEFELLVYFIANKNRLLTRQEIYKEVWKVEEMKKNFRTVDTYVKNLRKKLGINAIKSNRGIGYRWCEK